VAAVTTYFSDVLVIRISAVVAAIFLIAAYSARTSIVSASVVIFIRHIKSPAFDWILLHNETPTSLSASQFSRQTAIRKL
jgi:hypothetical protein